MERSGTVRAGERGDGARSDGERRPAASSMAVQYSEGLPLPWDRIHSGCDWRACFLTASVDAYSLWHFRQTKRRPWAPPSGEVAPSERRDGHRIRPAISKARAPPVGNAMLARKASGQESGESASAGHGVAQNRPELVELVDKTRSGLGAEGTRWKSGPSMGCCSTDRIPNAKCAKAIYRWGGRWGGWAHACTSHHPKASPCMCVPRASSNRAIHTEVRKGSRCAVLRVVPACALEFCCQQAHGATQRIMRCRCCLPAAASPAERACPARTRALGR